MNFTSPPRHALLFRVCPKPFKSPAFVGNFVGNFVENKPNSTKFPTKFPTKDSKKMVQAQVISMALLTMVLTTGCRHTSPPTPSATLDSGATLIPEQAAYDVQHYDLNLRVNPKRQFISGTCTVEAVTIAPLTWFVLDLDPRLKVTATRRWSGQVPEGRESLPFEHRGARLWIFLGGEQPSGERVVIDIAYQGHPRAAERAPWDGGFTWATTTNGHPWIATTVQGEGADLWWPCKDHPSDKPQGVSLRINVPRPLVVASNGKLADVTEHEDGTRTYHWVTRMPISNYNVALNIAPYATIETNYTSITGETVPVTYWVLPENMERGNKLVPEFLEHLSFYERHLGPYPFRAEKYGVAETPHLGMEHQTIIGYGNRYRGGPHGFDWLHHHELGHEWWGNLVTVSDWRDFWIHEGFCTYMQALYAEEREGIMAYHHSIYESQRKIVGKHPMVPPHSSGMAEMGKSATDVYYKGAWILHTLRFLIGKEALLQSLRQMCYPDPAQEAVTDGSVCRLVTSEDYITLVERISGRDLDWLFNLYLRQAELPELETTRTPDTLTLRWIVPESLPFPMPLEVQIDGERRRIEMPEGKAELQLDGNSTVLLDPSGWILKKKRLIKVDVIGSQRDEKSFRSLASAAWICSQLGAR